MDSFLLGLSVTSEAQSFHSDWGKEFTLFSNSDIDKILGISNTFSFNRGDFNFFSQNGKSAYAYWSRFVRLSDSELSSCDYDHDQAVLLLFQKLETLLGSPSEISNRLEIIKKAFDCTCQIELFFPQGLSGALFKIPHTHLKWLAGLGIPFQFRMIDNGMMKEIIDKC